jgi:hypothetical protein
MFKQQKKDLERDTLKFQHMTATAEKMATARYRCAPVEHTDIVQAEKAALKQIVPFAVLSVQPPLTSGRFADYTLKWLAAAKCANCIPRSWGVYRD